MNPTLVSKLISMRRAIGVRIRPHRSFTPRHTWLGDGTVRIAISHHGVVAKDEPISIAGFARAWDMGFRYMETDLRQLASGELVAFHQVGDGVESMTLADLRAAHGTVPTADELLTSPLLADAKWNFELKGGDVAAATALGDVLSRTDSVDRVCISFGTTVRVDAIRDALPNGICMSATLLERAFDWGVFAGAFKFRKLDARVMCAQLASEPIAGTEIIQVSRRDVRQAHRRGLAVHVYDVLGIKTAEQDVERLLDAGVDGIITDDHEALRNVFVQRGLWPSNPSG